MTIAILVILALSLLPILAVRSIVKEQDKAMKLAVELLKEGHRG